MTQTINVLLKKNQTSTTFFYIKLKKRYVKIFDLDYKKNMETEELTHKLLEWYQTSGRDLPWRVKGGAHPDPYIVLVSEIMLQQTTVKTVIPYFEKFIQRFPNVESLAQAELEEVYRYWQGLGYYTRAKSLHQTAQIITEKYNGKFPSNKEEIKKLKGLGAYTVASFLALAFNQPETAIDGNVTRIICRLYHLTSPVDSIKKEIEARAARLTSQKDAADYTSAIMDLGATICTKQKPNCLLCPWSKACQSKGRADVEQIPVKNKIEKKQKQGAVYLIYNQKGEIFITKRSKGLLSGLYEFPWTDNIFHPLLARSQNTQKSVNHIFTHINLTLQIHKAQTDTPKLEGQFVPIKELSAYPMSTLMKKVIKAELKNFN